MRRQRKKFRENRLPSKKKGVPKSGKRMIGKKKKAALSGVVHKTVKIFKRRDFRGHAFCHKRIAARQRKGYSPLRGTQ